MTDQGNSRKRNQQEQKKQEQHGQPDVTQVPDSNLDEPDIDLYSDLDKREMIRDADKDEAAQDDYGSQNPIGSQSEPGTPGGEGIYDVQDQYGQDHEVVQPGSDQDQYGYQQNIE